MNDRTEKVVFTREQTIELATAAETICNEVERLERLVERQRRVIEDLMQDIEQLLAGREDALAQLARRRDSIREFHEAVQDMINGG